MVKKNRENGMLPVWAVADEGLKYILSSKNEKKPLGNDLLSHPAAGAVPSALAGLTTGFGM